MTQKTKLIALDHIQKRIVAERLETVRFESQQKAFAMLENIPEGFFAVDRQWKLLYLNKEAERIAQKQRAEILGKHFWKLYPRLTQTKIYEKYTEAMSTKRDIRFKEYFANFESWFETSLYPTDEGLAIYVRNIPESEPLQNDLSSLDFEEFAYIASHNLQEPLRMISSYLDLLREEMAEKLEENSSLYLKFAQDGAGKLRSLIRDILDYSQVSIAAMRSVPVDCSQIVSKVLDNLKSDIESSQAKILHQNLPTINAAPSQLLLIFQNIISNAIKFRSERIPEILIRSRSNRKNWIFEISDNGIGIDSQDCKNLFKIFKRLHQSDKYSGNGIGLATTKKIIERHSGKIWVESTPQVGSRFLFSLPKQGVFH